MLRLALLAAIVSFASIALAQETTVIQDFEKSFDVTKWPTDAKGDVTFSKEWKKGGQQSLKIDGGLMAAISDMKLRDWTGYSILRMHFKNAGKEAVRVGFELADDINAYQDRHQNAFSLAPGENVIDVDIATSLWRGEENRPYRGASKNPINIAKISRIGLNNNGEAAIYVDQIELVKVPKIACEGGFAFAFGKGKFQVMSQFIGINDSAKFDEAKGYGLVLNGRPQMNSNAMSFPTPLLGNGLGWNAGGFKVTLPGGKYIGWIAFERGGFWEGEYASYEHLALKNNGKTVHEHDFALSGACFKFQDTEILDESLLVEKLIFPAAAAGQFTFEAAKGENHFTIDLTNAKRPPLVAGLILAPDTEAGRAFLKAHLDNQAKAVATTFKMADKGRRADAGRVQPGKMVVRNLAPGETVYPHDWPAVDDPAKETISAVPPGPASDKLPGEITAIAGQKVTLQFGVYAKKALDVTVSAEPLKGPGELKVSEISHGRFMPQRPYGTGICWLDVNHYRPEPKFNVGPDLSRPLLVEIDVPADAKAGAYAGEIKIAGGDSAITVPVKINVLAVNLPAIPIPVGLFMNAAKVPPGLMDKDQWWKMQESLLAEQGRAGLNMTTGGDGLEIAAAEKGGKYVFTGDNALKYLALAKKYGMDKAFTGYGGYWNVRGRFADPAALADSWAEFEKANNLPPFYAYAYDEPGTPEELKGVVASLSQFAKTKMRTIGYTSVHAEASPDWEALIANSYAPAFNIHSAETFKKYNDQGKEAWCYNNGSDRYGFGLDLWRKIQLGAKGKLEWIANFEQGFAFDNLDGREPSYSHFKVHSKFGVMKTNLWLAGREGLLDCRIRLALEAKAPKDDPALKTWTLDGYQKDRPQWTDDKLQSAREAMLKRLVELSK